MITLTITPQEVHTYLSMYELLVDTSHAGYVTSLESCQLKLKYLWKHKSKPNKGVYISDPCEICI